MKMRMWTMAILVAAVIALGVSVRLGAASNDVDIPKEYIQYCEEIGEMYCISPEMLEAIIEHESGGEIRMLVTVMDVMG